MVARVETEAGEVRSTVRCSSLYAFDFIDGFSRQPGKLGKSEGREISEGE
jgi:hypothetical protein